MTDTERVNSILERIGSKYRAHPGERVNDSVIAVLEALPEHIDRLMDEWLAKVKEQQASTAVSPSSNPTE